MTAVEMEDWSLQAIVRGSSGEFSHADDVQDYDHCFDHDLFQSFPEIFDLGMESRDGLEELYKPFYPQNVIEFQENRKDKQKMESDQSLGGDRVIRATSTPKYKRRKNQQKRVVIQVSAEGLASDKWAWRKYGQKPIKGSPYPRSYYRCSSSKGCLARKQVEQSCTDPGMFIITYSAEHSHSQPTRRNSLSGTIRQKFSSPKSTNLINLKQEKTEESSSNDDSLHPSSAHFSSTGIEFPRESIVKQVDFDGTSDELIFNDEFFSGLEEFDDFLSELSIPNASSPLVSISSCS